MDDLGELKQVIDGIREHMQKVLINNTTPEEDEKLRNCIIQSFNKTQSLADECAVMETDLSEVSKSRVSHHTVITSNL